MDVCATLDRVALMVLVRYLRLGGENESIEETMAELGLTNRNYFYRMRSQLYRAGLLTREGRIVLSPPTASETVSATSSLTQADFDAGLRIISQSQSLEPDPIFSPVSQGSMLSRIVRADHMDDTGDRSQRSGPFQARRKVQIKLLQEAFAEFWPNPDYTLTESAAKNLLNLAGDCAEAVYEAMEKASARDLTGHPGNYVRGILRKQAETEQQPRAKSVTLEPEPDFYLTVPTPRIAAKEAKLRALGMMEVEED